jgi:hypothetical protein
MRRRAFVVFALSACMPRAAARRDEPDDDGQRDPDPGLGAPAPDPASAGATHAPTAPAGDRARADADLEARVRALRDEYGEAGYTVLAEPPFAVIGDQSAREVQRHAASTVRWATQHLRREYFPRDPDAVVDVWLFADEARYRRGAKAIFGDDPDTPFGYYSPTHRALIMNIGSGGGTLVHEMVHPLMEANFPACPSWFNEGLASLYEQCGEEDGRIWGYTNWRLPGLQSAIRAGTLPPFADLLASGDDGFYGQDPGTNYGQARYLCYWLQVENRLRAFYRDFVAASADDPTGEATLTRHVGGDLVAFQRDWERFVLGLRFG